MKTIEEYIFGIGICWVDVSDKEWKELGQPKEQDDE